MAESDFIRPSDLQIDAPAPAADARDWAGLLDLPLTEAKAQLAESFEREAISRALDKHDGNVSAAARQLGIHRQSLQQKMTQLGIPSRRGG
jgi:DNA-binding NtrC family response regulator